VGVDHHRAPSHHVRLKDELGARLKDEMPVFGTCAGLILLSENVLDGREISGVTERSLSRFDETATAVKYRVLKPLST